MRPLQISNVASETCIVTMHHLGAVTKGQSLIRSWMEPFCSALLRVPQSCTSTASKEIGWDYVNLGSQTRDLWVVLANISTTANFFLWYHIIPYAGYIK